MIQFFIKHYKEITIVGALSVLTICYFQQRELTKLRTEVEIVKAKADSIRSEDFVKYTIISRYEITMDYLKEVNPKVAKQTEEWMSHNTE